jgi:acetyl esterase/lipase
MTPARSPSLLLHPPLAAIYLRGKRAAAGVPVEYECCEGTIHGFMNMGRVLRTAHGWARQRIAAWLRERLHKA